MKEKAEGRKGGLHRDLAEVQTYVLIQDNEKKLKRMAKSDKTVRIFAKKMAKIDRKMSPLTESGSEKLRR